MRILFTGGTGTLGRAVVPLLLARRHEVWTPARRDLDITRAEDWDRAIAIFQPETVVHAAAFTGVDKAEVQREACYRANVDGTRHGLRAVRRDGARFVYISTDYVFDGERGNYGPEDPLSPVNYYALTKTLAEMAVREYDNGAVIRTSFAPDGPWRFPKAWEDLWTGKDYVSVLAPDLAQAMTIPWRGVAHVVTARKSVYDLAKRSRPDVLPVPRAEAPMKLPRDVSLDTRGWEEIRRCWSRISRSRS